jgi:uncharacterized membrane protein
MVWLELSSNGIRRASLVIFVISFSILLILTLTSNFGHFELFSKDNNIVINGIGQNLTTQCLQLRGIITQNITNNELETKNSTESNTGNIHFYSLLCCKLQYDSC